MDLAWEYLWAAGYNLPPEIPKPTAPAPRRGKKAARIRKIKKAQK